ncbi:flagellar hook-basal body complex protein FliE [Sulfurimonas sp. C5]|uniref:flagellar hook-basal body complex protein FliE n=1 Tax=Sulfurimonas sp. C5 TaxID=3036947 RepID=UPI002454D863|nr:flagellar hook-basal body complex protein FliE [Sulfurimonas sp. C5]MDH4944644.1 flagellar hook-basal body complex protein FliE [Sulfurimonas sp. C5]
MANNLNGISNISTADLLGQNAKATSSNAQTNEFAKHLKDALNEANEIQQDKEEAIADLATGQVKDLHQAAMAIGKAETSMKLMLEIRNKALSAYKEISRTQL